MKQVLLSAVTLVCLAAILDSAESRTIVKRGINPIDSEQLEEMTDHGINRDKRKVEVVTGVKNAVIGFVFNKINSFIDQKTAWIDQLDKTNIAKNAAHNIVPPADPVVSLSSVISGAIGNVLQASGPVLNIVTNKLGSGSSSGGHTGFSFGALLNKGFGSSHGSGGAAI
nr:uncharacterized protein LOC111506161 isoform X2 [Leptinotarsa decemlineata]